ncbi:efflux RND transporter permease subunit [Leptolyngbya sp. FACHB-1624]|uniref:efflux RND transporter permease subunit n=1 Tax=Leptolyngbya TaxID=47251 RepID=UPI001F554A66|nr:efflux RND transporter permease subunit [Leptolyngbya sp. FACHB-1624]
MLCSRFLRVPHHAGDDETSRVHQRKSQLQNFKARLYNTSESVFNAVQNAYAWSLRLSLKHHRFTMLLSGAILVATVALFVTVSKGFIASTDVGQITGSPQAAQDIFFDEMSKHQQAVVAILRRDRNIAAINSTIGSGGPNGSANTGRIFIRLKPRHDRTMSADEIVQALRPKLSQVPGIKVFLQNPPAINIGGQQTKAQYQFTLSSPSFEELQQASPKLEEALRKLPELQDVNSDLQIGNPQVQVTGLEPQYQQDENALNLLSVRSTNNQLVPLNAVTTLDRTVGPLTVNHTGQLASVTLSFNLKPGISLGDVTSKIEQLAKQTLPETVNTSFQGSAQAFQSSLQGLGWLLVAAILVIYIVLGILYEDFIHPLTILSSLPSAGFGALLTLLLFKVDLNIYAFVGIILLIGTVKKNGIMMVDFAIEARRDGKSPYQAIYQACLVRFRLIMMTTMAALMGTLPIALGFGAGADARLGLAVVGGLVFSQLLTLYLTPVFYTYMEAWQTKLRSRKKHSPASQTDLV